MCGIVGAVSLNHQPLQVERLKPMVDVIAHRGPDDAGYLVWQTGTHHPFGQDFTDSQFQDISPLLPVIDSPSGQNRLHSEKWDLFFGHRRLSIIDLSPRGHQPMCDKSRKIWLIYNGEIYNFREIRQELKGLGYQVFSASDTEVIIQAYHDGERFVSTDSTDVRLSLLKTVGIPRYGSHRDRLRDQNASLTYNPSPMKDLYV